MAWTESIITVKGIALVAELISGGILEITKVELGESTTETAALAYQKSIASPISVPISIAKLDKTESGVKITVQIKNTGAARAYKMRQFGIYAKTANSAETLFAVFQSVEGEEIPSESEYSNFLLEFTSDIAVSNTDNISVVINPATVIVTGEMLEAAMRDYAPTYTTAEKLTELSSGEKLSTAFGKIAKAVKSLIEHIGDKVKHITTEERTAWNSKAAGNHTHSDASQSAAGFMSAADKAKLDGVAVGANAYIHPTASGNKHIPSGGSSGQILRWSADGTAAWGADNNTTYSNMTAATASAAGKAGLVPAPAAGAQAKYLRGDGTWQTPPDTNTTYGAATTTAAGLMSAADKVKLDSITEKATVNTASNTTPKAAGTAAVGTETAYARGDHVHPLQTTIYSTAGVPTTSATYYLATHATNSSANKSLYNFSGLYTSQLNGTADALGYSVLALGNSTASGTANNKYGVLRIYGTNSYYTNLKSFDTTSAATRYIVGTSSAAAVGSATQPVYIGSTGTVTKCTYTLEKSVPSDAVFTDTVYTHPTTAGNKHIPTGGTANQILTYSASGTAAWSSNCYAAAIEVVTGTRNSVASSMVTVSYKAGRTKALVLVWDFASPNYCGVGQILLTGLSSSMTAKSNTVNLGGGAANCTVAVTAAGNITITGYCSQYCVIWFN